MKAAVYTVLAGTTAGYVLGVDDSGVGFLVAAAALCGFLAIAPRLVQAVRQWA